MTTIIVVIHIIVSLSMIGLVLLQHGKGADMGATFGGSSQTVFGSDGPVPLLNKITTGAAIIFMITSVILAYHSAHSTKGSLMQEVKPAAVEQKVPAPAAQTDEPIKVVPAAEPATTAPAGENTPNPE